jgi:colanic acid/amylovoran biosynthesis glycosyltransferase
MRIAYVTTMKRGLPAFVYRELEQLADNGTPIAIFTTKYARGLYMPQSDWPVVRAQPVQVMLRQPWYALCTPLRYTRLTLAAWQTRSWIDFLIGCHYARQMRHLGVSAIHCVEGLHALAIGYYCHTLTGLPLSVTIHADALYMANNWPIIRTALHACRFVTTVCDFNRRKLIDDFGLPSDRVQVVRLFVDAEVLRPERSINVLIVGQFSQRKGHETLLRALQQLPRDDIRVWVVGAGTWGSVGDYVDVRRLAHELGVADRVTFFGSVSDEVLRTLYQTCDIFCLPSRKYIVNEGLPVSLMEAMACGKPVISTRHAGIPELVPDILIDENDASALAKALDYLADRPEVRRTMGERNRRIVSRDYSPSNAAYLRELLIGARAACDVPQQEAQNENPGHWRGRLHRIMPGQ